jgi:tetratricopeptide (TPR) repeat protein
MLRIVSALLVAFLVMGQSKPDPQALYKAGFDARVAGDNANAIRLLSVAIATGKLNDNDRATSYNNRGMAYAATDQNDKAIADYTMAIKIASLRAGLSKLRQYLYPGGQIRRGRHGL